MLQKIKKITSQIKKLDLYIKKKKKKKNGDNPKCVTLSSDKIVEFVTTFGPPVSLFVLLMYVVFYAF